MARHKAQPETDEMQIAAVTFTKPVRLKGTDYTSVSYQDFKISIVRGCVQIESGTMVVLIPLARVETIECVV